MANQAANLVALGDTVRLNADGTGVETGVELAIDTAVPDGAIKRRYAREFDYRLAGDRIEVEFPCLPDALMLCAAPPHYVGNLITDGLESPSRPR